MRGESTQRERERESLWKYPPHQNKKKSFHCIAPFFCFASSFFFLGDIKQIVWYMISLSELLLLFFLFLPIVWISKVLTYDYLFWFRSPKILWKYGFHILSLPISELCSYLIQYQLINGHLEKLIKRVGNTVNSISYNCIIAVIAILYETLDII